MTLDRKTQKIKRELKQLAKELERTEHEKEEIERGKEQQVRARNKLRELREHGLGSFLEQRAEEIDFDDRRRLLETFFHSSDDYIAISGRGRALKASGLRASLDCEWRSMFDCNLMKITAEQIQSGRTLSKALEVAKARYIYLSEEWIHPFYLP